jgi:hypothetical protein
MNSKIIKNWKQFNENQWSEKDQWWEKNYKDLIEFAENEPYENWEAYTDGDEDLIGYIDSSTAKHQALFLLDRFSIEELEEMIQDYKDARDGTGPHAI